MKSKEHLLEFRTGKAMARFEIAQNTFKEMFPDDYEFYKRKISWLSECEAKKIVLELLREKSFNYIIKNNLQSINTS